MERETNWSATLPDTSRHGHRGVAGNGIGTGQSVLTRDEHVYAVAVEQAIEILAGLVSKLGPGCLLRLTRDIGRCGARLEQVLPYGA